MGPVCFWRGEISREEFESMKGDLTD